MSTRNQILKAIQGVRVPHQVLPEPGGFGYDELTNLVDRFAEQLREIGGECVDVSGRSALREELERRTSGRSVVSRVRSLRGTFAEVDASSGPLLASAEMAVVASRLGVAENGAVWLTEEDVGHRVLPVIVESLIVVLSADAIVPTMHEAYAQLQSESPGFGQFVAGPSKTADIEQSLVVGAHGAKEMIVILTN